MLYLEKILAKLPNLSWILRFLKVNVGEFHLSFSEVLRSSLQALAI